LFSLDSGSDHWRLEILAESGNIPEFRFFPEFGSKITGNYGSGSGKMEFHDVNNLVRIHKHSPKQKINQPEKPRSIASYKEKGCIDAVNNQGLK
jgi:hypothetical protein